MKQEVIADHEKADLVLGPILDAMRRGINPFDDPKLILPQDIQNLPVEMFMTPSHASSFYTHANYWMQGSNNSVTSFRQLKRVMLGYWWLFRPEIARNLAPESVARMLECYGMGFHNVRARWWVQNAEYIYQNFGGDTLNMFYDEKGRQIKDWRVLLARWEPLKGFGPKIVPMNIYWHVDAGLIEGFDCPTPSDIHNHRTLTVTECVGVRGQSAGTNVLSPPVMDACREVTMSFCVRHNVPMEELADAVWLFSRHMCSDAVGNRSRTGTGIKRRKGSPPEVVDWRPSQVVRHNNTCRRCVIAQHCKWCYRSAPYNTDKVAYLEPKPVPPPELAGMLPIGEPSYLKRSDAHRHLWTFKKA